MKIEVVLNPKTFGKKASIVWEPDLNNDFVQWWVSWYVDKLLFAEPFISKRLSLLAPDTDIHGSENISKFLGLQEKKLKDAIDNINTFLDPENYFPVSPKQVSFKRSKKKTRELLNTVHRYFVRVAYPTGPWNTRRQRWDHRRFDLSFIYNWEVDCIDREKIQRTNGDTTVKLEGDFVIADNMRVPFRDAVLALNNIVHDVEPILYSKSKRVAKLPKIQTIQIQPMPTDYWKQTNCKVPGIWTEKKFLIEWKSMEYIDIPPHLYEYQSSDDYDVWAPQDCILGKGPSLAYIDEDDAKQFDINNGHQVNFGFEFSDREDRRIISKSKDFDDNKIPFGWPLGRIINGKEHIADFWDGHNGGNKIMEIKIHE
tara:strand:+ start:12391 stop:13497 length:1107 start_codon:yes stop_codon:yes gene_type:complete